MDLPARPPRHDAAPTPPYRTLDAAHLTPTQNYMLLAGVVVPRPIAFVSTVDADGVANLAPYSFFTVASANPPMVLFCPAVREPTPDATGGTLNAVKDTLANIRATGEFVINIVSEDLVGQMNQTAAQVAPQVDEFALAGLTPLAGERVRAPRVAESSVHMECRLVEVIEASKLPMGGSIVLGEVVCFHVAESVLGENLHIEPDQLKPVGRMAGADYVRTTDRFALERPR